MGLELYTKSQKRRLQKVSMERRCCTLDAAPAQSNKKGLRETYSTIYINKSDDADVFLLPKTRAHLLISLQTKNKPRNSLKHSSTLCLYSAD